MIMPDAGISAISIPRPWVQIPTHVKDANATKEGGGNPGVKGHPCYAVLISELLGSGFGLTITT